MSGGYDPNIVYGNSDALTRKWNSNSMFAAAIPNTAGTLTGQIIPGNSFYLDAIYVQVNGLIWIAGGGFTLSLFNSPSPTNIVGATGLASFDVVTPTSAPTNPIPGAGIVMQLTDLKYHNNLGRNGFLLASINVTVAGGAPKLIVAGGTTSLIN